MSESGLKQVKPEDVDPVDAMPGIEQIDEMGDEIMSSVQSLREMLKARADALEQCGSVLTEQSQKLVDDRGSFTEDQASLCDEYDRRETELKGREERCRELERDAARLKESSEATAKALGDREKDLQVRLAGVQGAHDKLEARENALSERENKFNQERQEIEVGRNDLSTALSAFEKKQSQWANKQREQTSAAEALQQERTRFRKERAELMARHDEVALRRAELTKHEKELEQREQTLSEQAAQMENEREDLLGLQNEWQTRLAQFNKANERLLQLKSQLEREVGSIAAQKNGLLDQYGVSEKDLSAGAPANGHLPSASEHQPKGSVERFQKLRRDAKRRAIGA